MNDQLTPLIHAVDISTDKGNLAKDGKIYRDLLAVLKEPGTMFHKHAKEEFHVNNLEHISDTQLISILTIEMIQVTSVVCQGEKVNKICRVKSLIIN